MITIQMRSWFWILVIILLLFVTCTAYQSYDFRRNYKSANALRHETKQLNEKPFLKAHYRNGNVSILKDSWQIDTLNNMLLGKGVMYNFNRIKLYEGDITVPIDSIAIFETNQNFTRSPETERIAGVTVLTTLNALFSFYCVANPKACFGSCPTFYINESENVHNSDAEAFSSAIAPSLEYWDIDALGLFESTDSMFSLTMKNEALETHCVKDVSLYAFPIGNEERVFHSNSNDFYLCENTYPLQKAFSNNSSITSLLEKQDLEEWFSYADENNLSTKEEIILEFETDNRNSNKGLIIDFRQTLMTTYFIYSAMGYMGDEVGDVFAQIETTPSINNELKNGLKKELGNIEIYVWNQASDSWVHQGGFNETGPIAINSQVIPLENYKSTASTKIKVVLNKGLWRIDYAALTDIKKQVHPNKIIPESVQSNNKLDSDALKKLNSSSSYLYTYPGDNYKINYSLPDSANRFDLFLFAEGYYLEWMRERWLADKNLSKLNSMVNHPKTFLKSEAANYKIYEQNMEEQFWSSKINEKLLSKDEK